MSDCIMSFRKCVSPRMIRTVKYVLARGAFVAVNVVAVRRKRVSILT